MSIYLDASFLVALFTDDPFSDRADRVIGAADETLVVSDFAAAELASAVARHVRMAELSADQARAIFSDFDDWMPGASTRIAMIQADIRNAEAILRRLDLPLRAPDALHIATAQRVGAELATFDEKMAASARALGVPLAAI